MYTPVPMFDKYLYLERPEEAYFVVYMYYIYVCKIYYFITIYRFVSKFGAFVTKNFEV